MYRCQITGELVGPNVPLHKVIVEKREKTYNNIRFSLNGTEDAELSSGWEIAKEINVSPDVYEKMTGLKSTRLKSSSVGKQAKSVHKNKEAVPWRKHNSFKRQSTRQPQVEVVKRNGPKF